MTVESMTRGVDQKMSPQDKDTDRNIKIEARALVEKFLPELENVSGLMTFGLSDITLRPFPPDVLKVWELQADRLKGVRESPVSTAFAKSLSGLEKKGLGDWVLSENEVYRVIGEIIEDIPEAEIKDIEARSYAEWTSDIQEGISRAYFDPTEYLARGLLYSADWYPKPIKYKNELPFPSYIALANIFSVEIREPSANVGFWQMKHWNFPGIADLVYNSSKNWEARIKSLPRITPQSVGSVSPPIAGFERSPSRMVQAVSKEIALQIMRFSQPLQYSFEEQEVEWFGYGDREARTKQMFDILHGKIGQFVVDGDDFAVLTGDGVVAGDASNHDASVSEEELRAYVAGMKRANAQAFPLWYAAMCAIWGTEIATNVGMLRIPPNKGNRSGDPNTHMISSWTEGCRILNCDWKTAESGRKGLLKFGFYRADKQAIYKETVDWVQLILSPAYPKAFGKVSRMGRSLIERERVELAAKLTNLDRDARIMMVVANTHGGPCFDKFAKWVRDHWDLRSSKAALMKLSESLMLREKVRPGHEVIGGKFEREALLATYKVMTTK